MGEGRKPSHSFYETMLCLSIPIYRIGIIVIIPLKVLVKSKGNVACEADSAVAGTKAEIDTY